MYLNEIVKNKDKQFKEFVTYLTEQVLTTAQISKVYTHFNKSWKLNKTQTDVPHVIMTEKDIVEFGQKAQNIKLQGQLCTTRSMSRTFSLQKNQSTQEKPEEVKAKL